MQGAAAKVIAPIKSLKAALAFHDVDESGYDRLKCSLEELIHAMLAGVYSVKDFFTAFRENPISASASAIMGVADKMFSAVRSAIDSAGSALERLGGGFGNVLERLRGASSKIRSAIGSMVGGAMEKLAGFAGSVINTMLHPFQTLKNAASAAIGGAASVLKSVLGSAFDWVRDKAAGLASTVINAIAHPFQTVKGVAGAAMKAVNAGINGIIPLLQKVGDVIKKSAVAPFKLMGTAAEKAFSSIGKGAKSSNNMFGKGFKNILKYGLGIRSVYALINKLRAAVKEGFSNLAQYSSPVNESLSMLKSSLTQLKNSLATAFAPIITTVAPLLKKLIDMVSQAATYVGMFIATLTGAGTFTKAVAVQEDYAESLGKTAGAAKKAVKALAGFDKLNVLGKTDADGGGAGGTSPQDMFEEVKIPDSFKNIAQQLKEMWEAADFYELGKVLGEKLKAALDSIPWTK